MPPFAPGVSSAPIVSSASAMTTAAPQLLQPPQQPIAAPPMGVPSQPPVATSVAAAVPPQVAAVSQVRSPSCVHGKFHSTGKVVS